VNENVELDGIQLAWVHLLFIGAVRI